MKRLTLLFAPGNDWIKRWQSDNEHEELYHNLVEEFFSMDNILTSMSLLFVKSNICMNDSVTDLLQVLMTEKMSVHMNQFGFAPFKSEPMLYIEYQHCTKSQIAVMQRLLLNARHTKQYVACSHMSTGASVMLQDRSYHCKLDPKNVLFALYRMIHASKLSSLQKHTVYNILMQRLRNSVAIPNESLIEVKRLCDEFKESQQPAQVSDQAHTQVPDP